MLLEHCKSSSKEHLQWDVSRPGIQRGPPTATLVRVWLKSWDLHSHLQVMVKGFFINHKQSVLPCLKNTGLWHLC